MYCVTLIGDRRCGRTASYEYLRAGVPGSHWRRCCSTCAETIRTRASPLDKLRIRKIEIDDEDEANRRRQIAQKS